MTIRERAVFLKKVWRECEKAANGKAGSRAEFEKRELQKQAELEEKWKNKK
jgi:hypothetical protein